MRVFMKSTMVALLVCALATASAFGAKGKVKKETVTFDSDVMVNGTLLKAGEYQIKFDEETGELSILRNGKVKAKATARVEARSDKAKGTAFRTREQGSVAELISITFGGAREDVVLGASGAVTGN